MVEAAESEMLRIETQEQKKQRWHPLAVSLVDPSVVAPVPDRYGVYPGSISSSKSD